MPRSADEVNSGKRVLAMGLLKSPERLAARVQVATPLYPFFLATA